MRHHSFGIRGTYGIKILCKISLIIKIFHFSNVKVANSGKVIYVHSLLDQFLNTFRGWCERSSILFCTVHIGIVFPPFTMNDIYWFKILLKSLNKTKEYNKYKICGQKTLLYHTLYNFFHKNI